MKTIFLIPVSAILFVFLSCGASTSKNKMYNTKDTVAITQADTTHLRFPEPKGYVNDFNDVLSNAQESELDSICKTFDQQTTNQLVVTTIANYQPYNNIADYSTDMFNEWKIGTKEKNNGLLIVFCKDCHEVRIATGLGTEKILTQEKCDKIMELMVSDFKQKKFYEGLKAGVNQVIEKWK